jgi:1-acyl-sn-glycerol-3-phosphate acyltransferase
MQEEITEANPAKSRFSIPVLETRWFGHVLRLLQVFLWWPIVKLISLRVVRRSHYESKLIKAPGTTYIIAANHQSAFDHFMILATLPLSFFRQSAPYRFMTLQSYFKHFGWRVFLILCGAFPARPMHQHIYGLEASQRFLKLGQTVLIFPEGTRTYPRKAPARSGVTVLAQMQNVMVIPARIQWYKRSRWNRSCTVSLGTSFKADTMDAEEILDRIYALPPAVVK